LPGAAERSELTDLCWPSVQAPDCGEPQVFGDLACCAKLDTATRETMSGHAEIGIYMHNHSALYSA
jgi:hypothetical protein